MEWIYCEILPWILCAVIDTGKLKEEVSDAWPGDVLLFIINRPSNTVYYLTRC
jgi:hypothetical protein